MPTDLCKALKASKGQEKVKRFALKNYSRNLQWLLSALTRFISSGD